MASDHQEPSRRKHRRNSDDESEEPSKRHKHRHHHRRHRHHRSRKLDEEEVETKHDTGDVSHPPPPAVVELNGNLRPDYDDMEEGEILEDDQILNVDKKNMEGGRVEVDGSSLSLEGHNVEKVGSGSKMQGVYSADDGFMTNGTVLRKENSRDDTKIGDEVELQRNSNMENHGNGDISKVENSLSLRSSSPEGLEKQKGRNDGESESSSRRKSSENAAKMHKSLGSLPSHDKHHEKDRSMNRSQLHNQAAYDTHTKRTRDFEDDTVSGHHKEYRHGSRDSLRDKERERSSSRSRHTVRVYSRESPEARARDRERSLESRDQDCREMVRESARERNGNRERDREREKERNREEENRRVRERERSRDKYYDRGSRNHNYYDVDGGYRDRDRHSYDHRRRRRDETEHRDRSRNDPDKVHSSKADIERDTEEQRRDEVEEEDYQGKIVLQLAEHDEEEIDRIKEESRKRRQAILEKYKAQQSQQKHESNLEVTVPNVVKETHNDRTEEADIFPVDTSFSVGKSPEQIEPPASKISGSRALGEGTPKSERSDDMFHDDIFGDSPAGVRKPGREVSIERSGLHDNWDDAEGYYSYRFGEILDGRYEVVAAHGKGVFSSVVRAKDLKAGPGDPDEVAIKIIRSNDTMHKAGLEELVILKKLVGADVEDRRHCVRFLSSFKYRNHLCLVFESLHMNLREVLKKFGRNIGLKLTAVRTYTKQLFIALKHLRNCGVLHCDIKPDNMLVNDAKNVLKLCDFGNAMFAGKNEITPYLVSRFYRAPEIILGLPYDHPMDIWSVGCCLYELYTGKVLFPGPSNNDMLRLHMELKGPFPKKMLRKGAFIDQHFDQDLNFLATEEDPVTKKAIKRLMLNIKPKDIGTIIVGSAGEDPKMLANFKDLLEKIFMLDPDKRITVSQALSHPFITELRTLLVAASVRMMSGWEASFLAFFSWIVFY